MPSATAEVLSSMASTATKPSSDNGASATSFSYAQAAKGRVTSATTSASQSNQESGATTPAKVEPSTSSATHDEMDKSTPSQAATSSHEETASIAISKETTNPAQSADVSSRASTSAAMPLQNEEAAPLPAHVADQNWRSARPRASNTEPERRKKGKGRKSRTSEPEVAEAAVEKEEVKPEVFVEAVAPAVNIWQQRSQAQAAKVKPTTTVIPQSTVSTAAETAPKTQDAKKKAKSATDETTTPPTRAVKKPAEQAPKKEEVKRVAPRGLRNGEKDDRSSSHTLPPVVDAGSWPTPEIAVEEQKKKVQEKQEREDTAETASTKSKVKKADWQALPFTPSVTFNTPMPSKFGTNRGERGDRGGRGSRGGREQTTRGQASDTVNGDDSGHNPSDSREKSRDSLGVSQELARATTGSQISRESEQSIVPAGAQKQELAQSEESQSDAIGQDVTTGQQHTRSPVQNSSLATHFTDGAGDKELTASFEQQTLSTNAKKPNSFERKSESGVPVPTYTANGHVREPRDGARGGRGRGGYKGTHNFSTSQQVYVNGHGQLSNGYTPRQNSVPNTYSPSAMQSQQYSGNFIANGQRGRGGGPARAQSIPNGPTMYARWPQGTVPHHMGNMPGLAYDFSTLNSAEFPQLPMVTTQAEYYFSIENLCKDIYLRKQMDSQGFVHLTVIARFKRIAQLIPDIEVLRAACQQAQTLEIVTGDDGIDRVRRQDGWEQWVFPQMADRDESARNAGPARYFPVQSSQHVRGLAMPSLAFSPNGTAISPPQLANGMAIPSNGVYENGTGRSSISQLSASVNEFVPVPHASEHAPPTTFDESRIPQLSLLYSQPSTNEHKTKTANSRTFSDGSVSVQEHPSDLSEVQSSPKEVNGTQTSESSAESQSPSTLATGNEASTMRALAGQSPPVMWLKDQSEHTPSTSYVRNGKTELYTVIHQRFLQERHDYDAKVLYDFWSHFLIRSFNLGMYEEFRSLAMTDALQRHHNYGLDRLIAFYYQWSKGSSPDTFAREHQEAIQLRRDSSIMESGAYRPSLPSKSTLD